MANGLAPVTEKQLRIRWRIYRPKYIFGYIPAVAKIFLLSFQRKKKMFFNILLAFLPESEIFPFLQDQNLFRDENDDHPDQEICYNDFK